MDGQPVSGTQLDLPPGTHKLAIDASGFQPLERQVLINPGSVNTVTIELQKLTVVPAGGGTTSGGTPSGPTTCDAYGPSYNRDGSCFDTRPAPLTAPRITLPADATDMPRIVILVVHVSQDGVTLESKVLSRSNLDAFTQQAIDFAKDLHWTPAQKNGEPVEAWTQLQILPQRP
jgi:hypothetical protein